MNLITIKAAIAKYGKYWRETLIVVLLGVGVFGYQTLKREKSARQLAEANVAQAKVEMETYKAGTTQANNDLMASQKDLMDKFSSDMQDSLKDQKAKILAAVNGTIQAKFDEQKGVGKQDTPTSWEYSDQLMSKIAVDAKDPVKPKFDYTIAPFAISLDGSLNFQQDKGVVTFWMQPRVIGPDGISITTNKLTLTPGDEFIQWETTLKGKTAYIPVMPKWTVDALFGREWSSYIPGGYRNVWGAEGTRNFTNGIGIGGGFIGSTVFVKAGYSFGK
jgi:hypothetical protein